MPPLSTKKAGISGKAEYPQKARVRHPLEEMPGLNYATRCAALIPPKGLVLGAISPAKYARRQPLSSA